MIKNNWKKIIWILIALLAILGCYLAAVLISFLIYDLILKNNEINIWNNILTWVLSIVLIVIIGWLWFSSAFVKFKNDKKSGQMPDKDWNKIGTKFIPIDENSPLCGWVLDAKINHKVNCYKHLHQGHCLVYGITRSGKTSGFVLPTMLSNIYAANKPSMVVLDMKGELFSKTYSPAINNGYKVFKIDMSNGFNSDCWNPLLYVYDLYQLMNSSENNYEKVKYKSEIDNYINSLLDLIVLQSNDQFWNSSAKKLIKMMIYLLLTSKCNKYQLTFSNISRLLNSKSKSEIKEWIMMNNSNYVVELAGDIINTSDDDRTFSSVVQTAISSLNLFTDSGVEYLTSATNFDINELSDKPTILYLVIDETNTERFKLASVYLEILYTRIVKLRNNANLENLRPILFILDELGNIPTINKLPMLINVGLGRKLQVLSIFQSDKQLKKAYPKDYSSIEQSGTIVYISTKEFDTAERLSNLFGTHEVYRTTENYDNDSTKRSLSKTKIEKPIFSPNDLLNLPRGKAIISLEKQKPRLVKLIPVDKTEWYKNNVSEFYDEYQGYHYEIANCGNLYELSSPRNFAYKLKENDLFNKSERKQLSKTDKEKARKNIIRKNYGLKSSKNRVISAYSSKKAK